MSDAGDPGEVVLDESSLRRMVAEEAGKPKITVVTHAGRDVVCEVHEHGRAESGARIWHALPVDRDLRRSEAARIVNDPYTPLTDAEVVLVQFACEHQPVDDTDNPSS